jgi:hypothetical protein
MTHRFTVPSAIVATFAALSSARAEEVERDVEEVPAPTEEVIEVSGRAPTPT